MDFLKENKNAVFYIVGILVIFVILFIALSSFFGGSFQLNTNRSSTVDKTVQERFDTPPSFTLQDKDYWAVFDTNFGIFEVDLYEKNAPLNVNNFVFLTSKNYYDGLTFYRMVDNLLIQSGSRTTIDKDQTNDDRGFPGYIVSDEINWDSLDLSSQKRADLTSEGYTSDPSVVSKRMNKYSLVMANSDKPNTAGSQFFIVLSDDSDPRLDYLQGRHTVIGEVKIGNEIVDKLSDIAIEEINGITRPKQSVVIKDLLIIEK